VTFAIKPREVNGAKLIEHSGIGVAGMLTVKRGFRFGGPLRQEIAGRVTLLRSILGMRRNGESVTAIVVFRWWRRRAQMVYDHVVGEGGRAEVQRAGRRHSSTTQYSC